MKRDSPPPPPPPSPTKKKPCIYGGNTPHADRSTFGIIETKYRYWNLRNAVVASGRLEQEQRIKENILWTRMLPNGRPYEIESASFSENEQQTEH